MASRRYSKHVLPPGVAELLPGDGAEDIIEMWNLRTMNASGAMTPADVKGFVSTLVDMLPQHRYVFASMPEHGDLLIYGPISTIELLIGP